MELTPREPKSEVAIKAREVYLTFARRVIGESNLDYSTLYQRFAQNDWAAIKLDDAIAEAIVRGGYSLKSAVGALHQGPYVQFQVHQKGVPPAAMTQYVRSTVLMASQRVSGLEQRQAPSKQKQSGLEME